MVRNCCHALGVSRLGRVEDSRSVGLGARGSVSGCEVSGLGRGHSSLNRLKLLKACGSAFVGAAVAAICAPVSVSWLYSDCFKDPFLHS